MRFLIGFLWLPQLPGRFMYRTEKLMLHAHMRTYYGDSSRTEQSWISNE